MTARENFISNIKFLRDQSGLTLHDVALNLGINWKRYQQWERGNGTPGYNLLVQVAEFYDTGIDNLLTVDLKNYGKLSGVPAPPENGGQAGSGKESEEDKAIQRQAGEG